jgi:hypothetical protein
MLLLIAKTAIEAASRARFENRVKDTEGKSWVKRFGGAE